MKRSFVWGALLALVLVSTAAAAPIRAVMYVGGCCHDYKEMPKVLAEVAGREFWMA